MAEQVYMETNRVRDFSAQFGGFNNTLQTVSNALEVAITILDATAFIGMVGGTAVARYLEQFQPVIQQAADKCDEIRNDLTAAVEAFENGDATGSTRFY